MFAHKYRGETAGMVLVDGSHPDEPLPFSWRTRLRYRVMQYAMPLGLPRWRRWCGVGPPEIAPIKRAITCRSQFYRTAYKQRIAFPDSADEIRNLDPLGDLPLVVIARDPERSLTDPRDSTSAGWEQHWNKLQHRLAELSSNATCLVAKGSGHDIPAQRPDVVVNEIQRVIEKARKKN